MLRTGKSLRQVSWDGARRRGQNAAQMAFDGHASEARGKFLFGGEGRTVESLALREVHVVVRGEDARTRTPHKRLPVPVHITTITITMWAGRTDGSQCRGSVTAQRAWRACVPDSEGLIEREREPVSRFQGSPIGVLGIRRMGGGWGGEGRRSRLTRCRR